MKIKAIALDLDGTLLNSEHRISQENKKTLHELNEKGIRIILVTGRSYEGAKKFARELDFDNVLICYNGAKVVSPKTEEVFFELPVPGDCVKELISISKETGVHLNLYQNNIWYVENEHREEAINYALATSIIPVQKDFSEFENYDMTKALFISTHEALEKIYEVLEERLGGNIYKTFSQPHLLEVLNREVNKAVTLKRVLESYDLSLEECIAFGDGMNDLEMLTEVGMGVAMANANPLLKKHVSHVTLTNNEDGVAFFLKKLFK